jgi:hypothetical protein
MSIRFHWDMGRSLNKPESFGDRSFQTARNQGKAG